MRESKIVNIFEKIINKLGFGKPTELTSPRGVFIRFILSAIQITVDSSSLQDAAIAPQKNL